MPGMYPDDQVVEIFGEEVLYPGLDPVTHKFTDGDFSDPLKKPSHIPASTFNLMLDNMESLIRAMGLDPNNTDQDQLLRTMKRGFAPRIVGQICIFFGEISQFEMAELRLLKPNFQLLAVEDYSELFERYYCGDENNTTAPWWYRCNDTGTVRDINGTHFRVIDPSGLFPRFAGQNKVYGTAGLLSANLSNNALYDGKLPGEYQAHKLLNHSHNISNFIYPSGSSGMAYGSNYYVNLNASVSTNSAGNATENAPASISCTVLMSY